MTKRQSNKNKMCSNIYAKHALTMNEHIFPRGSSEMSISDGWAFLHYNCTNWWASIWNFFFWDFILKIQQKFGSKFRVHLEVCCACKMCISIHFLCRIHFDPNFSFVACFTWRENLKRSSLFQSNQFIVAADGSFIEKQKPISFYLDSWVTKSQTVHHTMNIITTVNCFLFVFFSFFLKQTIDEFDRAYN